MTPDDRLDAAMPTALALAGAVRLGIDETHELLNGLDRDDLLAVAVALAILVPDDRTVADLTAWTHGTPREPVWCAAERLSEVEPDTDDDIKRRRRVLYRMGEVA